MTQRVFMAGVLGLSAVVPAAAQSAGAQAVPAQAITWEQRVPSPERARQAGVTMQFVGAVESQVTTGRPYSAEAITEFVQVLGDGNRIARKSAVRVFRDGEGRTRREELGPADAAESISIYDPVARTTFILKPETRTAHKTAVQIIYPSATTDARGAGRIEAKIALGPPAEMAVHVAPEPAAGYEAGAIRRKAEVAGVRVGREAIFAHTGAPGPHAFVEGRSTDVKTEALGEQVIEGVKAHGSRTTSVIPAGQIGNQHEIRIVSEQWFSEELQLLVMTKYSDPRSGETTYRLTNVVPGEPGQGLFEVPPDYTITESTFMRKQEW